MHVHPDVPELNFLLAFFVLWSKFPPDGGSTGTLVHLPRPTTAAKNSNKDAVKPLNKIVTEHVRQIYNDPKEKEAFGHNHAPGTTAFQIGIHSAKSSAVTRLGTDINGPSSLALCFRSGAAVGIESMPTYLRGVHGADHKCKTLSGFQELVDMNRLPPHFGLGGAAAFVDGVDGGWASMFPAWEEYDDAFRSIFPLMMASAVHHQKFLKENLDPSHYLWETCAWQEVLDTEVLLDAEWLRDSTKSSWMHATGVDATNTLHNEVRDLKDEMASLRGMLDQCLKHIESSGHPTPTATSAPIGADNAALTLKVQQLEAELARRKSSPSSVATGRAGPPAVALASRPPSAPSTCPPHAAFQATTDSLVVLSVGRGLGVQPLDEGTCTCTVPSSLTGEALVKKKGELTKNLGKLRRALSDVSKFVEASAVARSKSLETDADVKQVLKDLDGFRRDTLANMGIVLRLRGGAFTNGAITTAQKSVKGLIKQSADRWGPCAAFRHAFFVKALNSVNPVYDSQVLGSSCACVKCKARAPGPPPPATQSA